jgi:hypothetical protein
MGFGRIGCRQIIASFDGGKICSDIGLMLRANMMNASG